MLLDALTALPVTEEADVSVSSCLFRIGDLLRILPTNCLSGATNFLLCLFLQDDVVVVVVVIFCEADADNCELLPSEEIEEILR